MMAATLPVQYSARKRVIGLLNGLSDEILVGSTWQNLRPLFGASRVHALYSYDWTVGQAASPCVDHRDEEFLGEFCS